MPELPEVEYARRQLRRAMKGERIARVLARRPALRYPLPPDFVTRLTGQTVRDVRRRAKYLLADLASGDLLLMHLGMSGDFRVTRDLGAELFTHDHVIFDMAHGPRVIFNDPRRFGFMTLVPPGEEDVHPALAALGPEPLDRSFTAEALAPALARRRASSLKAALSDQRVVAGLGNIYVCEALHLARLSPTRRAATLVTRTGAPTPAADALVAAIRQVLREAIASSHRLYAADRFRVYDREGERCPRRGCGGTIRRLVQVGRSTFFCPTCQR